MSNSLMVLPAQADRPRHALANPPGVSLAPLTEADLPSVADAYFRTYLGTDAEMSASGASEDVQAAWDGEYGTWLPDGSLGAWIGSELVGVVMSVRNAPWDDVPRGPFIIDLFVLPEHRRRGIARALVTAACDAFTAPIGLRVDDSAEPARRLYESLGFVSIGRGSHR